MPRGMYSRTDSAILHDLQKLRFLTLNHSVAVLLTGELFRAHILAIVRGRLLDLMAKLGIAFDKARMQFFKGTTVFCVG